MIIPFSFFITTNSSDSDAQAFLSAAGITDPLQVAAVDALVVRLKSDSLWTKMSAIYPFVGGTATTHKFNLKNPLDTNAAFRINWFGSMTHDANGVSGNGSIAYGETNLVNNTMLSSGNKHVSIYLRNVMDGSGNKVAGSGSNSRYQLNYAGTNYACLDQAQAGFTLVAPQKGFIAMSKTSTTAFKYYQNSLTPVTKTGTNAVATDQWFILDDGLHNTNAVANIAFMSLGEGLSDAEIVNLNTAISTFQTSLSRNV
jgi:hypothetical protein